MKIKRFDELNENKKPITDGIIDDFMTTTTVPTNTKELKDCLFAFLQKLAVDPKSPMKNLMDLVKHQQESRRLVMEYIKALIGEYKRENSQRSQISPLYRKTVIRINELQNLVNKLDIAKEKTV